MDIYEGQSITARVSFTNTAGAPADPTAVTLRVRSPGGIVTVYTPTTRTGIGAYAQDLVLDAPGRWYFRWEGTGALAAVVETMTEVAESRVI